VEARKKRRSTADRSSESVTVDLTAVVVAVTGGEPRVLTLSSAGEEALDRLPSGPLTPEHRTLEQGLRAWVETQTGQVLGYAEQLYTFGDRDRRLPTAKGSDRILSIGYLTLVRGPRKTDRAPGVWQDWYRFFPWEDWRDGRPACLAAMRDPLMRWATGANAPSDRRAREERLALSFGFASGSWNEDRVLERYELAYEAGLVAEAHREGGSTFLDAPLAQTGRAMAGDHRRILATAIARLRGKIKYRPVVFELMPPAFTLLQLQQTVEALAGLRLHKPNFRRLVEQQGLVEETGAVTLGTGGRPARLVRFRREAVLERSAPGLRVRAARRARRAP
jgi:hypothetical protein